MDGSDSVKSLVMLALEAATLRHQAIANNIANANSASYVPLKVNFEQQLAAARSGEPLRIPATVRPFIEADRSNGARVMLDMEMVKLAQNTVHYQSLLKALEKRGAIVSLAVNEGRR